MIKSHTSQETPFFLGTSSFSSSVLTMTLSKSSSSSLLDSLIDKGSEDSSSSLLEEGTEEELGFVEVDEAGLEDAGVVVLLLEVVVLPVEVEGAFDTLEEGFVEVLLELDEPPMTEESLRLEIT